MAPQPIDIVFERRGQGDPLVLLHGIGHRWQAWEPVLDLLAATHDVIAIDMPGFGASPPLPPGRGYDMPSAVAVCAEIFADLGLGRPHVAGNSLGGVIALELACRGLVSSATALAPAGFWTARDRAWALWVLRLIRRTGSLPGGTAMLRWKPVRMAAGAVLYGHPSRMTREVMLADLVSMTGSRAFDLVAAAGREYSFAGSAPAVPVTVGWGSRDRVLWPRQARRAAELLPSARHVSLPGCGHVPMIDDPRRVASLILETCAAAA